MIKDTTVLEKEEIDEINTLVGKPFSLLERLRWGRVGSHRMIIESHSDHFNFIVRKNHDINYCNIELRPRGIIIHFNKRNMRYSWIIPFYKLVLFRSKTFSIHANGIFLKIRNDRYLEMNHKFIRMILEAKVNSMV